ncbi:hypothetical protein C7S17_5780 [Burkholderia thailandensis]|nr:hypothetical protein [Burkholderia thailandensis]
MPPSLPERTQPIVSFRCIRAPLPCHSRHRKQINNQTSIILQIN